MGTVFVCGVCVCRCLGKCVHVACEDSIRCLFHLHYLLRKGISLNLGLPDSASPSDPPVSASQHWNYRSPQMHPALCSGARDLSTRPYACSASTFLAGSPLAHCSFIDVRISNDSQGLLNTCFAMCYFI